MEHAQDKSAEGLRARYDRLVKWLEGERAAKRKVSGDEGILRRVMLGKEEAVDVEEVAEVEAAEGDEGEDAGHLISYATWMPYQVAQAKRAE